MSARHVLTYHLAIPAVIFAVLLVVGVPLGPAFFVGMMAGCMSMMVMMMGGGHRSNADHDIEDPSPRR
jgi:hypothetical protein